MNKIIILLFILLIGMRSIPENKSDFCIPIEIENYHVKIKSKEIQDNKLIQALIQVESRGNDSCIGDKHLILPSIGCLQIRPVMVREVNRILKKQKDTLRFKYKDRWSRKKSIQMFYIWKDFHHTNSSDEKIARNWNGGPKGYKRKRTLQYWEKVKIEMNKKL
jgi:hypothetical protein